MSDEETDWVCSNCSQINETENEYCKHCNRAQVQGSFSSHSVESAFDPDSPWEGE